MTRKKLNEMDDIFVAATPLADNEPSSAEMAETSSPLKKLDGRNLLRTGRKEQFATRLKQETKDKMYEIVEREKAAGNLRFTYAELIELAIDSYERERGQAD